MGLAAILKEGILTLINFVSSFFLLPTSIQYDCIQVKCGFIFKTRQRTRFIFNFIVWKWLRIPMRRQPTVFQNSFSDTWRHLLRPFHKNHACSFGTWPIFNWHLDYLFVAPFPFSGRAPAFSYYSENFKSVSHAFSVVTHAARCSATCLHTEIDSTKGKV